MSKHVSEVVGLASLPLEDLKKAISLEDTEQVNHPEHYNHGSLEVIKIIEDQLTNAPIDAYEGFCVANALKYVLRAPYKGKPEEDVDKAIWYLEAWKSHQSEKSSK